MLSSVKSLPLPNALDRHHPGGNSHTGRPKKAHVELAGKCLTWVSKKLRRILKRENGNWKIAMEAFARAGVIDAPPAATGSSPPPAKAK